LFEVNFLSLQLTSVEAVVVLSDLVRVLAWSWHLDRARPVRVHVAEPVSQVLEFPLGEVFGLVKTHVEVNRSDATLRGLLWNQEEVKSLIFVILDELLVNDAAGWRVLDGSSIPASHEHSLVDPLVDHGQSDGRSAAHLVVQGLQGLLELTDLLGDDLVSHLVTHTISVDDDLGWSLALMAVLELLNGGDQASIEIILDQLLVLGLDDDVRVVLSLVRIGSSAESNDTFLSCMAHIDSDDHDSFGVHECWPLHPETLTTHLGVNLLHDVGSNRHVHPSEGVLLDALSHNVKAREYFFDLGVVTRSIQDEESKVVRVVLATSLVLKLIEVLLNGNIHP